VAAAAKTSAAKPVPAVKTVKKSAGKARR